MKVNKNIRNEIIVSYLNGKDIFTLASKYNQDINYIRRTIEKYQQPVFKKVFLLDEENISFNLFSKTINLSVNDTAYIFSNKNLKLNTPNIIQIPAPILKFKNSLDYRLIIGIGEIMNLHKKDIAQNLVQFIIVSNDSIFCEVINSIDVDISVLKITPDVNNTYNLVKIFRKVIPQIATSNSSSVVLEPSSDLCENNISIKVKEELSSLLNELDANTSLEIEKLFKKDLEKNSPKLCSNLQSIIVKSTPDGNKLFSSLSKLFKTLKKSGI